MARTGAEGGWEAHEVTSVLYTLELGPDKAPVTLLPEQNEGRHVVDPEVLQDLHVTAYSVPMSDSSQLDRALQNDPEEFYPFAHSVVRLAYQERRPLYMTFGSMPVSLLDAPPTKLMNNEDVARLLAAGAFVLVAGHIVTTPRPETYTRRNLLAGGAAVAATTALYMSFLPEGGTTRDAEIIKERLTVYSPQEQETMAQWYWMLRGFSNLVLAQQLHEVARLRGTEGEHVVALAPADNAGLRAALLIPPYERDTLIVDFLENVINPIFDDQSLGIAEYRSLLESMSTIIEAQPEEHNGIPTWTPTFHRVVPFAEPSE
ncbi:MAG: hypothetical protein AAB440_01360 [Patescibacteria group bacterium]